jgi:hypothetical protein
MPVVYEGEDDHGRKEERKTVGAKVSAGLRLGGPEVGLSKE